MYAKFGTSEAVLGETWHIAPISRGLPPSFLKTLLNYASARLVGFACPLPGITLSRTSMGRAPSSAPREPNWGKASRSPETSPRCMCHYYLGCAAEACENDDQHKIGQRATIAYNRHAKVSKSSYVVQVARSVLAVILL